MQEIKQKFIDRLEELNEKEKKSRLVCGGWNRTPQYRSDASNDRRKEIKFLKWSLKQF